MSAVELADRLRLVVITDTAMARPRSVVEVVELALRAGAPAVQLRNRGESARELVAVGGDLRWLTRTHDALFFVNDRLDVALTLDADGVHVGPDDPPVAAIRRSVGEGLIIGRSADDPVSARRAVEDGASYIGCGTVYATSTKENAGQVIGLERLGEVARAVSAPVVAIGGITPERSRAIAGTGAAGVAVIGAVMTARDVEGVVTSLLSPWRGG